MFKLIWNTTNVTDSSGYKWGTYHKYNSDAWIYFLLEKIDFKKISDLGEINQNDSLIVVDSSIERKKSFYMKLNLICSKIFLFHLGDEFSAKDVNSVYELCSHSWRTFCTNAYFNAKHVSCIPLGYKSGIQVKKKINAQRTDKWSFIGTPHKSSRQDLLFQLSKIKPHFIHSTKEFNDKSTINAYEMGEILLNTKFAPCPNGFFHPETYRVYEALECGCIPIVESSYHYYDRLFPDNPFLKINKWIEAKDIIFKWEEDKIEKKKEECKTWWLNFKTNLQNSILQKVKE